MQPHSPNTRDAALRRLASLNRWLIAASAALTGLFAAVAATAFPGKTVKARAGATQAHKGGAASGAHSGSSRLRAPAKAPESSESTSESPAETTTEPKSEAPVETEKAVESEKAVETEKPVEAEKTVETEKPTEANTEEAPVVSGGS